MSITEDDFCVSQALTVSSSQKSFNQPQELPYISNQFKKTSEPKITSRNSESLMPENQNDTPYPPRETSDAFIKRKVCTSHDTDFNSLQTISDDPDHVMLEITKVSDNLLEISFQGFSAFKRALEYFAQLSEKMLQLMQVKNTNHFASKKNCIGKLEDKIEKFKVILAQINSNLPYDLNSQVETSVKGITELCRDLHDKLHSK